MPAQSEQAALTAAYVAQQRLLATVLTRDVVELVRQVFRTSEVGRSWSATRLALDALIRLRRQQSADLAARYYVDLRRVAVPGASPVRIPGGGRDVVLDPVTGLLRTQTAPRRAAQPAVLQVERLAEQQQARSRLNDVIDVTDDEFAGLSEDDAWAELDRIAPARPGELTQGRVDANLNATGVGTYQKAIRAGRTEAQAVDTMGVNLSGSSTTLVLEGGREVVHEAVQGDEEAIGWARVGKEDPCPFCSMLISRGAIYRSEATAGGGKNKNFVGDEMFKFHDHDRCVAVPVFDPNDPVLDRAEALYDDWLRVTAGKSNQAARDAWRDFWLNRPREGDSGAGGEG